MKYLVMTLLLAMLLGASLVDDYIRIEELTFESSYLALFTLAFVCYHYVDTFFELRKVRAEQEEK